MNDIDEGRFTAKLREANKIRIEKTREDEKGFRICSFSFERELTEPDLDLMWAHYGNSHCGVKIDFKVDKSYQSEVFNVCYGGNPQLYQGENSEEFIKEILSNKKKCFQYEHEYRVILKGGKKYLPINICGITLGRKLTKEIFSNNKTEAREFHKDDENVRIARQFLKIWEEGVRKGTEPPKFYAYKTRYSACPYEIPTDLLKETE